MRKIFFNIKLKSAKTYLNILSKDKKNLTGFMSI